MEAEFEEELEVERLVERPGRVMVRWGTRGCKRGCDPSRPKPDRKNCTRQFPHPWQTQAWGKNRGDRSGGVAQLSLPG